MEITKLESERLKQITKGEAIAYFLEQGNVVLTQEKYDAQRAVIRQLAEALKEASQTIQIFHGEPAWEIYERSSPEMKRLRAALEAAKPWLEEK